MASIDEQLINAAENGEEDKVRSLLRQGANIEAVVKYGWAPLHLASINGHDKVVKLLLDEGAEVNAVNNIGWTPLHYAKLHNKQSVVKLLEDVQAGRIVPAYHAKKAAKEAKARAEAEAKRIAEQKATAAAAEKVRAEAEAKRIAEQKATAAAAEKVRAEAEAKRIAEEKKATAAAAEKVRAEAEAKRIAEQRVAAMIAAAAAAETEEESQANSKRKAGEADHSLGNQQETEKDEGGRRIKNQVDLTEEDIQFIRQGREIFASTSPTSPITPEERSALTVLASNLVDIERSLESVRGLPESLVHKPPEVKIYFDMFTSAFERSYVAALALSSGAVKVGLDLKDSALGAILGAAGWAAEEKGSALGELLGAAGWAAEKSNVPFAGCISIFSTIIMYQRETRKKNLFWAFQEFFGGGSQGRDHYLLTYRRLAEAICLRVDYSEYSTSSNVEGVAKIRQQLTDQVHKIVNCVRKHLRKFHLDALENLQPVEAKAMLDLSKVTEEVLRLYQEDQDQFDTLKAGSEHEKTEYLLQKLWNFEYACNKPKVPDNRNWEDRLSPTRNNNTEAVDSSEIQSLQEELAKLKEDNMALKNAASTNDKLQRQVQSQEKRIRKIQKQFDCNNDSAVGGGEQEQLQKSRNAAQKGRGESDLESFRTSITEIKGEIADIRRQQIGEADAIRSMKLDGFIRDRVLSLSEAHSLIEEIVNDSCSGAISPTGVFKIRGEAYQIGVAPKGRLSLKKHLWSGRVEIKIEDEYKCAKSVLYWFDKNKLRYLYESNKRAAIHKLFARELGVNDELETNECRYKSEADIRDELFGGL